MGVLDTTVTFANNQVVTSDLMNNIIDESFFTDDALANGTLSITAGKIKVATAGITSNELAVNAVTINSIADNTITNAKINSAAAISLSKLASEALPAGITVATANLLDANVTTAKIADAAVTAPKLSGAQTGTAPVYGVRAWAKLNPYVGSVRTGAYKSGNYVRSASGTTVTMAGHGLKTNDQIRLDFTSGTATDGLYTVTSSATPDTFVVNHTGTATSGNVTAQFVQIQGAGNISTASWYDSSDSRIVANFTTPMPNTNYVILATGQNFPGSFLSAVGENTLGETQLNTIYQGNIAILDSQRFLNVIIVG